MLITGGVSLIVQEGKWYLRVNIPILFRYHIDIDMTPERRERLIALIKERIYLESRGDIPIRLRYQAPNIISLNTPSVTDPVFYDGSSDLYYIPIP